MDTQRSFKELWDAAPVPRRIGAIAIGLVVFTLGMLAVNINWL